MPDVRCAPGVQYGGDEGSTICVTYEMTGENTARVVACEMRCPTEAPCLDVCESSGYVPGAEPGGGGWIVLALSALVGIAVLVQRWRKSQ